MASISPLSLYSVTEYLHELIFSDESMRLQPDL